ncbi:MAG: aminotransferase class IV [Candidatus Omnitrophica bacterium]|nr:aminotransferase class IV [Candidatus Omnitrophota bacterium]
MTVESHPQIFVNGKRIQSDRIYPLRFSEDEVFAFESLRSYRGNIFHLGEHLNRLSESANTIGLKLPKTLSALEKELLSCLTQSHRKDVFLRLGVDGQNSYLLILDRKRPAWIYERGVDLKTAVTRRSLTHASPPEAKTSAFFNNVLAAMEKERLDVFETIFLDLNGYVTEATVWNLFVVKEGRVLTPAVGVLHGVTKQFVIECARKEHLSFIESNLTRHDVWNAEESFLTSTSGEITPICSLDGRRIGVQVPGFVTKRLMERFRIELEKELSS